MTKSKENLLCTDSECIEDNGNHVLKCPKCNRNVHYRCTSLPAYQLQVILLVKKTRNSGYHCQNCVVVSDEIKELVPAKTRMIPLSASRTPQKRKRWSHHQQSRSSADHSRPKNKTNDAEK